MPKLSSHASFDQMLETIPKFCSTGENSSGIVDIITFCESPLYLNFLGQEPQMILWPLQRIVLKIFYRNSRGNEHIKLSDDEIEVLKSIAAEEDLDYEEGSGGFLQIYDKYKRDVEFTHLLLIMGRRSSKTTLVSIIAAYEAYKLLQTPNGNPQAFYGMAPDKNIHIINVAVNEKQALDPLFAEIESRIIRGPYFHDKINQNACKKGEMKLFTEADKRQNEERKKKGMTTMLEGSVVLMSGHSNSASLRGHATICVLFDEFAHFKSSTGVSSGDEVYNALTPSMKQFGKDGKVIILSDPKGKEGMFWKLFELSQKRVEKDGVITYNHDDILAVQLPTWCMNPNKEFSKSFLEATEMPKDPTSYFTTWGARFVGSSGMKMFDEAKLRECFNLAWVEPSNGAANTLYHMHLDPATTSHNYALALVHIETSHNQFGGKVRRIIVDKVKYWRPTEKGPVDINAVQDEIIKICKTFRVATVTFDSWQSAQTIQNLKNRGIRAYETPFRDNYITQIYGELKNLVHQSEISICPDHLLMGEMQCLSYKMSARGITKIIDKKSEFKSDDVVDAVAGAVFQAIHYITSMGWPKSRTVNISRGGR